MYIVLRMINKDMHLQSYTIFIITYNIGYENTMLLLLLLETVHY
jgi:hypothetical protein